MSFETEFVPLELAKLSEQVAQCKEDKWRFVQMLCINTDSGIDMQYSFFKDDLLRNYVVKGVNKGTKVSSITDKYLAAFVFENEAHDLFGVEIENIAIDFGGNFYRVAQKEPMTIISPEKKAAQEKAAKIAAAKAAKEKGDMPQKEDMTEKLAGMEPAKAAKLKAALEAKAKKEAQAEKEGE